jgi:hypothetical protein
MGCREKYTPFGIVNEDTGELYLTFGSSAKTSDFIVDSLQTWWEQQPPAQRERVAILQIKADNGPESNGRRTQFLKRICVRRSHRQTHSVAVLPLSRQIQSGGTLLGDSGTARSSSTSRPCSIGQRA